jgi:ferredoxin-type protein NapF
MADRANRRNFLRGRFSTPKVAFGPPLVAAEAAFVTACSRCGDCRRACLKRVIGQGDGGFRALDFLVRECIFCAAPCPTAAIDLGQSSDAS